MRRGLWCGTSSNRGHIAIIARARQNSNDALGAGQPSCSAGRRCDSRLRPAVRTPGAGGSAPLPDDDARDAERQRRANVL